MRALRSTMIACRPRKRATASIPQRQTQESRDRDCAQAYLETEHDDFDQLGVEPADEREGRVECLREIVHRFTIRFGRAGARSTQLSAASSFSRLPQFAASYPGSAATCRAKSWLCRISSRRCMPGSRTRARANARK